MNIKFHQNPSSWSRVIPCGRETKGQTNMKKLIVPFRKFANAPKIHKGEISSGGVQFTAVTTKIRSVFQRYYVASVARH
jgi:hypothetical protein